MTTGSRHLQRPLHALLTAHVAEIQLVVVLLFVEFLAGVDDRRLIARVAVQELHHVHQRLHAIDLQLVHHRCFPDVLLGYDQSLEMLRPCPDGDGQCTSDGLQMTVKTQFAHHHILAGQLAVHLAVGSQNTDGDGQVVARPFFLDIGRRQVDGDVHRGHLETVVHQCCLDAVVALLDGCVGQSCQVELYATRHTHLDRYRRHFQSVDCCTIGLYKHFVLFCGAKIRNFSKLFVSLHHKF